MKNLIVQPTEFGIEEKKANELLGNLPQIKAERDALITSYDAVLKLDLNDHQTAKQAREIRLKIRDNRTKGIDVWHKTTKEVFLRFGQFVDAVKRQENAVNQRMEENLEAIEKHAEIQENKRLDELEKLRLEKLEPFKEFVPFGVNVRNVSDEDFEKIFNGSKMQFDAKIEAERIAEEQRKEAERLAEIERIEREKEIEAQRIENERLKKEAEEKERQLEEERKKAREQEDRIEAQRQAELKAEREKQAKLEAELKAKKEAEEKAEREKIELRKKSLSPYISFIRDYDKVMNMNDVDFLNEVASLSKQAIEQANFEYEEQQKELQKKEAEKLAKEPVKKQMTAWIDLFTAPEKTVDNDLSNDILAKFESFKKWAKSEIEKL